MGLGPVPAVEKLFAGTGLTMKDIDVVELNEAFASQVLACDRELDFDRDRLNVNGGGIALGHPTGCSGARIVVTLLHELARAQGALRSRHAVRERRTGHGGAVRTAGTLTEGRRTMSTTANAAGTKLVDYRVKNGVASRSS